MPRRSSSRGGFGGFGSRSSGFSSANRSSFAASRPMPAPQPTMTRSPGMFSGLGSTLATGMAFGAGSEVAHQAIRGIMGPSYQPVYIQQAPGQQGQLSMQQQQQQSRQQPCMQQINDFAQCI